MAPRCLIPLLCALLAAPSASARLAISEQDVSQTDRNFPGLLFFSVQHGTRMLTSVGKEPLREIYAELEAGRYRPEVDVALRVVLQELSERTGAIGVEGRRIMEAIAGIAADSGSRAAIRGVAAVLGDLAADEGNAYGRQASDLLAEKIRCGAGAIDDRELIERIAAQTNPDRELALRTNTDGTVADRYGLHRAADLFSLAIGGDRIAAVGHFGTVLLSRDGGASWAAPPTGTDEPLYAAAFDPTGTLWAVGRSGVVVRSQDGETVTRSPTPFDRHYFGVAAPRPGAVRVFGDFGLQLASDNGGETWRCVPREEDVILGRVAAAGPDYVAVGEFGTIERLPGGDPPGRPARLEGVPDEFYVFDAWFDAGGEVGLAVGLGGTIVRSTDGGASWSPVESEVRADLYGVGGAGQRVVAVGEGGTIALSDDLGRSFTLLEIAPLPLPFYDVAFQNPEAGFVVGPRGLIGKLAGREFQIVHPVMPGTP